MSGAMQTPLVDLLRNVPADARVSYKHSPTDYQMIPVGRLANEAADEIERLQKERDWLMKKAQQNGRELDRLTKEVMPLRERISQLLAVPIIAERDALRAENDKLKTVMIAAAEEIQAHWGAHCDADGYGPQNLMRRLEEGIPSQYGYTAGAFAALRAERDAAFAMSRCECATDEACAELAKLRAEVAGLRKVLWKIVYLRPDTEHPPLHSEAEGIRILARAALGDKND